MVDNKVGLGYNKNMKAEFMQSNNVVLFPKQYNGPEIPSLDQIVENTDMMKHYHIQETISNIIPMVFNQLDIAGFDFADDEEAESEETLKEGAFIVESLRALMCRHYGIYHPFQDIWDNIFIHDVLPDGEPMLKVVDKINIEFKKREENK